MSRLFSLWPLLLSGLMLFAMTGEVDAVKLRRPYDQSIPFNYGFDNNRGAAGCTDYNCGGLCYDGHTGTDHPIALGNIVRAGEDGTVVATHNGCADYGYYNNSCGGYCGNHVRIRHSDGQETLYCHMKLNSIAVANGQRVTCGQQIGLSASSGSSTGPHLHVSWYRSGGVYDLFQGSCGSSVSAWTEQRGYREAVGTACGCVPSAEVCDGRDNNCNGQIDEGDVCEIDYLNASPNSYAQPRTTDINGDGLQDVCARFGAGWGCYLSTGDGWGELIRSDAISDAGGWAHPYHYATIRTGDLDGDGLADVCARHSTQGYMCWRSTGTGFEHYGNAPGYTNDGNWTQPQYYTTLRLADINGDGRDDVCARGAAGWFCQLSSGTGFGDTVQGPAWSDASGFARAQYYGTIQTGDINGDGKQDVCIRHSAGYECFVSTGAGFESFALLGDFTNAGGWSQMMYWSSLRLVDFNGDGKADVCARFYSGIKCRPATDTGFGDLVDIAPLATNNGWDDPTNYLTLRVGDVNGDGKQDFCVRANAGIRCYGHDGSDTFSLSGPDLSDESGWANPEYFHTIMLTDINPDRRRDICARGAAGLYCYTRTDDGFGSYPFLDDFTNAGNWNKPQYYSTLRMGIGVCRPELCNGFDDNCNGKVDEGQPTQMGHVAPGLAARFAGADLPTQLRRGEVVEATLSFENVGREAWQPDVLRLQAVAGDAGLIAQIRPTSGWLTDDIVTTTSVIVAPGETAAFNFPVRVPQQADVFEDILFVLSSADEPIACPTPSASLSPGTILDPGNNASNNTPGPNNPGNPSPGEPGAPDAGGYPDDAARSDAGKNPTRDKNMRTASTSSCAAAGGQAPMAPLWFAILGLLGLGWARLRRRGTRFARATVALFCGALWMGGCDSAPRATMTAESTTSADEVTAQVQPLQQDRLTYDPATPRPDGDPRLLAIFGDWELHAQPLALPPNSDAAGQLITTLTYQQKPSAWPLADRTITAATFVPPLHPDAPPDLLAITPGGEVLHVALRTRKVTPLDEGAARMVSVAASGCCAAYMKGPIGLQFSLQIVDLSAKSTRTIELKHNAWSPAISPDGRLVLYVAATDTGQTGIYRLELTQPEPTPQLLATDPIAFPTGPQPPVWTDQGIAFPSERGVYLMSPDGEILRGNSKTRELLVDLRTGQTLTPQRAPISFDVPAQ